MQNLLPAATAIGDSLNLPHSSRNSKNSFWMVGIVQDTYDAQKAGI